MEIPGVVLVMGQTDPPVLGDDSLVQTEDCLVTGLHIVFHQY